ncbi:hypothetical protein DLM75_23750 [Leptospira stimsonii]|uniref:Hint domain-containing protein n=2 Tax=Leptospira stimsonii TaxID=2202203 RepID=A0A396YS21_9LEPT|nr:hypothetical protein DLM75_23750 [Leptospira stimsonii]
MGAMESVSENVAANYAKLNEAHRQFAVGQGVDLSPEQWDKLSDSAREEIVQRLKTGNSQHSSRDTLGERVLGSVSDFVDQLTGTYADHSGWIDEGGEYTTRTCFVAGTLVHTKNGYKKIEEIAVGDYVLSYNQSSESLEYNRVVKTFVRETTRIYKIEYENGRIVETTETHPFYIEGKDWVSAKNLVVGDASVLSNESTLKVSSISIDDRFETVYNFEVENAHTYFVTEDAVLVHNKCVIKEPDPGRRQKLFDMMQSLTDDKLQMDANGNVTVAKEGSGKKNKGTILMREVIGNLNTTEIYGGEKPPEGMDILNGSQMMPQYGHGDRSLFSRIFEGSEEDFIAQKEIKNSTGTGFNSKIWLDIDRPKIIAQQNKKTGAIVNDKVMPLEFTLGHELIHSLHTMEGTRRPSWEKVYVNDYDFLRNAYDLQYIKTEEARTTGLQGGKCLRGVREASCMNASDEENYNIINNYFGSSQNDLMRESKYNYIRYGY